MRDGTRTYIWEHGRELTRLTQNGVVWNYTYDSGGMRTRRAGGTKNYNYIYSGSKLMQMSVDGYTFNFTYDASGTPLTVSLNGGTYYYVTNIQGDVVGILNPNGVEVVRYGYDAWGNVEILYQNDPIASYNPLLYRGYVYDFETDLYYLQSRYYDPALGRFINADGLVSTGQGLLGNNMFAYCGNNPIIFVDSSGMNQLLCRGISCRESNWLFGVGLGVVGVAVVTAAVGGIVFGDIMRTLISDTAEAVKEIYAYSRVLRQELIESKENQPQVHHIVPVGKFSHRSPETRTQIEQIHEMLKKAGINRFFDPNNLVLVSTKTHARLHTDAYIAHVYGLIMATDGSRAEIYSALFALRLEIAAWDSTASGY